MKPTVVLIGVIASAMTLVLSGCGRQPERNPPAPLPEVAVTVTTVELKQRPALEEVVGTVRAKLRTVIEAKVSGRIEQMPVALGAKVKTGDQLVQLSAPEIQAKLDQAQALQQQADADLKRFAALLETATLTRAEFDNAQARARVAQAAVAEAETLLGYTQIRSPYAGVVTRKYADVGDLASPGKPLLEMEDATVLRLEADVPEAVIGRLQLGDKLPVRIASLADALEGVVSEMAPAADPNSRTFLVKLDLPRAAGLRAGQFGRVAMAVGETTALRVPASAVVTRGQMEIIFVVVDGHAQLRLVKTGKPLGAEIEVVSGVNAGEQVVTANAASLQDGQPLTLKP
ncbi:MAG: efflux RND transporter periplasmic adaptor subunit [Verrucomicrobiae bacterium]|nr:efflux RND transporter periplasmic adaptor subunit [Verrucomicrobiae bacterium]